MSLILFHSGATGTAELKKYVSANISFEIDNMEPQIKAIAEKFVRDVLGTATYDDLIAAFDAATDEDPLEYPWADLLPYCQKIIANLACLAHTPIGGMYFSSMGFSVPQTADAAPASQWRIRDLKNTFAYDGFNAIEELLEFMWQSGNDYEDWVDSEAEFKHREFIVLTAKQFSKHFWIDDSYQLYRMLKPTMRMVETFYVRSVLGTALYDEIKQQVADDDLSDENAYLLTNYLYPAIPQITFKVGAPRLQINIGDFGITQNYIETKSGDNNESKKPAPTQVIDDNLNTAALTGEGMLSALSDYLYANKDDYPLYAASAQYTAKAAIAERVVTNGDTYNNPENSVHGLF